MMKGRTRFQTISLTEIHFLATKQIKKISASRPPIRLRISFQSTNQTAETFFSPPIRQRISSQTTNQPEDQLPDHQSDGRSPSRPPIRPHVIYAVATDREQEGFEMDSVSYCIGRRKEKEFRRKAIINPSVWWFCVSYGPLEGAVRQKVHLMWIMNMSFFGGVLLPADDRRLNSDYRISYHWVEEIHVILCGSGFGLN